MSDFVSGFWNIWVAGLTLAGIIGCAVPLKVTSIRRPAPGTKPELHGHTWDGDLTEYSNPLPRWWMWLFYITIVFSLVYLALYPGLGVFAGYFGWPSRGQYEAEKSQAAATYGPIYDKYAKTGLATIAADRDARATGQRLFLNYCAQCHGSDGGGARGLPNLADRDWLDGRRPHAIEASIADGRHRTMPGVGQPHRGASGQHVCHHLLSLCSLPSDRLEMLS